MGGADWRTTITDQMAVNAANVRKRNGTSGSNHANISRVGFGIDVHPWVVRAARARGISIAGYIRRSTLAMVALDLDLNLRDLLERDVAPSPFGERTSRWADGDRDLDGERYGRFEVLPNGW